MIVILIVVFLREFGCLFVFLYSLEKMQNSKTSLFNLLKGRNNISCLKSIIFSPFSPSNNVK